jgi:hypothetical protein
MLPSGKAFVFECHTRSRDPRVADRAKPTIQASHDAQAKHPPHNPSPGRTAAASKLSRGPKQMTIEPDQMRATWELYGKAWAAESDPERRSFLSQAVTADFTYFDPRIVCEGQEQMMKNLEAFQERTPGGSFALRDILPHHDVALVNWQLVKSDGTATNKGYDSVRFNDAGLIA